MCLMIVMTFAAVGQGFTPPSEGRAAVYFVRTSSLAFAVDFSFFDERSYIGDFGGRNYLRYECPPGTHLFWASGENKDFLNADLEAGGVYVVIVDVDLGDSVAHVGLKPITAVSREFARAKKLVDRKRPVGFVSSTLRARNAELSEFIKKNMDGFPADTERKQLSSDMAIPAKYL